MSFSENNIRNQLLRQLNSTELEALGDIVFFEFDKDTVLERPDTRIDQVYFIEQGLISVSGQIEAREIEVGLVGDEGMTGVSLLVGDPQSPLRTTAQVGGSAYRVNATNLLSAVKTNPQLSSLLKRYARRFGLQMAATAISNGTATLEERLARWILMAGDRMGATFDTTHVSLALILCVQRSGVTLAIHALEGRGLIRSLRGRVTILNREGLISASRGAYGLAEREYSRLASELFD